MQGQTERGSAGDRLHSYQLQQVSPPEISGVMCILYSYTYCNTYLVNTHSLYGIYSLLISTIDQAIHYRCWGNKQACKNELNDAPHIQSSNYNYPTCEVKKRMMTINPKATSEFENKNETE